MTRTYLHPRHDLPARAPRSLVESKRELRLDVYSRQCGLPNTPYGQHKSSRPHVDAMLARDLPYRAIGSAHLLVQFLVDPFFIPSELLDVLHPLEIAHGDATGVGENVRNDQDVPVVQDLIWLRASSEHWIPRR